MPKRKKPKPLTNKTGDVRELTREDFSKAIPFGMLPGSLKKKLAVIRKRGRPPSASPKQMIAFRFAPDVLAAIRSSGPGYNARVEQVLRDAIAEGRI